MIFIQVLAYTVFAALGTVVAEALEAKLGQHLGMGVIAWMAGWAVGSLFVPGSGTWDGLLLLLVRALLTGVGLAFVCGLASFIVYTVNARQALIIGVCIGIGHVLLSLLIYWMLAP
jgi:hypothetical protein